MVLHPSHSDTRIPRDLYEYGLVYNAMYGVQYNYGIIILRVSNSSPFRIVYGHACDRTENHTHVASTGFRGASSNSSVVEAKQAQERQELYTMAGLYSKFKSAIVSHLT